jgi:hypothetical protein
MSLLLELSPELETRLKAVAAASEQTPAQWLLDLAACELAQREAEDAEDLAALRGRRANPDPRPNRTLARLQERHAEIRALASASPEARAAALRASADAATAFYGTDEGRAELADWRALDGEDFHGFEDEAGQTASVEAERRAA